MFARVLQRCNHAVNPHFHPHRTGIWKPWNFNAWLTFLDVLRGAEAADFSVKSSFSPSGDIELTVSAALSRALLSREMSLMGRCGDQSATGTGATEHLVTNENRDSHFRVGSVPGAVQEAAVHTRLPEMFRWIKLARAQGVVRRKGGLYTILGGGFKLTLQQCVRVCVVEVTHSLLWVLPWPEVSRVNLSTYTQGESALAWCL